eukprot:m.199160 g.199160  ORF g.199160 m.199160 type:complete len:82 (+) comp39566_c0_seq4:2118-2363(+)
MKSLKAARFVTIGVKLADADLEMIVAIFIPRLICPVMDRQDQLKRFQSASAGFGQEEGSALTENAVIWRIPTCDNKTYIRC